MKARCITIDPDEFPVGALHKQHFKAEIGAGRTPRVFSSLHVGQIYVVYAIYIRAGYPYFFVECKRPPCRWRFQPALCFEIIDPRPSKLWVYESKVYASSNSEETFISTLAIKEWTEEATFHQRLVDGEDREVRIMSEAAALMDLEDGDPAATSPLQSGDTPGGFGKG